MTRVAIIPARGGSKRIPHKNIKEFLGHPMLHWPIAAAKETHKFDRIVVSTDDPDIADCAKAAGVEALMRPDDLSDDYTGVVPVIRHAMWTLPGVITTACLIYATAPFLRPEDLRRGLDALEGADFALSVTSFPFPIQRAVGVTPENRLQMFYPEHEQTRSQDLPEAYHDAALFAWGTRDAWFSDRSLFGAGTVPVPIPRHRVQDLDTAEDWTRAEYMGRALIEAGEITAP
ncbi:MAG: pseudaminic acid cytidylyltransferase [Dinoroseobacter sp.]|uniref:pseudaminic acid cytidylyltransferase n=1 Tax=Alterinioella nitratireducens TaxID=2735915 RepID=UPI000C4EC423|nr:pseudaminic acid cytidylyltransferase [Alterinioella nitratireducens]MAN15301.1 pseudaminic acid cytidylyltransferase [Dinoroseobacter sp.]MAX72132.1 pseudaminic acid cytidylyltransferase [Nioella sp.]NPD19764.1 pseudaminic acid cytidylyltransferase [Alterinioella nitratireducens]|tara:strand:- start:885 stop:1577 length:693 start_codon:yes stop_codon:yes gene_type:complete